MAVKYIKKAVFMGIMAGVTSILRKVGGRESLERQLRTGSLSIRLIPGNSEGRHVVAPVGIGKNTFGVLIGKKLDLFGKVNPKFNMGDEKTPTLHDVFYAQRSRNPFIADKVRHINDIYFVREGRLYAVVDNLGRVLPFPSLEPYVLLSIPMSDYVCYPSYLLSKKGANRSRCLDEIIGSLAEKVDMFSKNKGIFTKSILRAPAGYADMEKHLKEYNGPAEI